MGLPYLHFSASYSNLAAAAQAQRSRKSSVVSVTRRPSLGGGGSSGSEHPPVRLSVGTSASNTPVTVPLASPATLVTTRPQALDLAVPRPCLANMPSLRRPGTEGGGESGSTSDADVFGRSLRSQGSSPAFSPAGWSTLLTTAAGAASPSVGATSSPHHSQASSRSATPSHSNSFRVRQSRSRTSLRTPPGSPRHHLATVPLQTGPNYGPRPLGVTTPAGHRSPSHPSSPIPEMLLTAESPVSRRASVRQSPLLSRRESNRRNRPAPVAAGAATTSRAGGTLAAIAASGADEPLVSRRRSSISSLDSEGNALSPDLVRYDSEGNQLNPPPLSATKRAFSSSLRISPPPPLSDSQFDSFNYKNVTLLNDVNKGITSTPSTPSSPLAQDSKHQPSDPPSLTLITSPKALAEPGPMTDSAAVTRSSDAHHHYQDRQPASARPSLPAPLTLDKQSMEVPMSSAYHSAPMSARMPPSTLPGLGIEAAPTRAARPRSVQALPGSSLPLGSPLIGTELHPGQSVPGWQHPATLTPDVGTQGKPTTSSARKQRRMSNLLPSSLLRLIGTSSPSSAPTTSGSSASTASSDRGPSSTDHGHSTQPVSSNPPAPTTDSSVPSTGAPHAIPVPSSALSPRPQRIVTPQGQIMPQPSLPPRRSVSSSTPPPLPHPYIHSPVAHPAVFHGLPHNRTNSATRLQQYSVVAPGGTQPPTGQQESGGGSSASNRSEHRRAHRNITPTPVASGIPAGLRSPTIKVTTALPPLEAPGASIQTRTTMAPPPVPPRTYAHAAARGHNMPLPNQHPPSIANVIQASSSELQPLSGRSNDGPVATGQSSAPPTSPTSPTELSQPSSPDSTPRRRVQRSKSLLHYLLRS
ncbi:hypothetical protein H4R35_005974 [Dimargaris xerosporica]|nr:hypothetical protein H4R35_005974 [Dimargaris xerosporica]